MRDPSELQILGQSSVKAESAKLYWKFFVLEKYGGVYMDRNVFINENINLQYERILNWCNFYGRIIFNFLRDDEFTVVKFENKSSISEGLLMSSAMGSEAIQKLVNVSVLSTEQSFQKDLENELFTSSVSKRIINNEGELFNSFIFYVIES